MAIRRVRRVASAACALERLTGYRGSSWTGCARHSEASCSYGTPRAACALDSGDRAIPAGTTTTYGGLATALGQPKASRAVGLVNGANPVASVVPCHRVIGANGALTGYAEGIERKRWLLDHEREESGVLPSAG